MMEKPIHALQRRGVRYVELRSLDVNAFHPLGIADEQVYFIEALMLFCLLHESPPINVAEQKSIDWNELTAAHQGRKPGLKLQRKESAISLRDWGLEICEALLPICEILETGLPGQPYSKSLQLQKSRLQESELTPSARMLREMREKGEGFYHFAQRMSKQHQHDFMQQRGTTEEQKLLSQEVEDSWRRQREIEASDTLSFDEFLEEYFAQQLNAESDSKSVSAK
jgi:glutamate--cysteine ligase